MRFAHGGKKSAGKARKSWVQEDGEGVKEVERTAMVGRSVGRQRGINGKGDQRLYDPTGGLCGETRCNKRSRIKLNSRMQHQIAKWNEGGDSTG